jgi:hypothetical protein
MRLTVLATFLTLLALVACSRKPEPAAAAGAAAQAPAFAAAPAPAPMSSALLSGDAEGLRNYLQDSAGDSGAPLRRRTEPGRRRQRSCCRAAQPARPRARWRHAFRFATGDPALGRWRRAILFLWGIAVRRVRAVETVDGELVVSTTG